MAVVKRSHPDQKLAETEVLLIHEFTDEAIDDLVKMKAPRSRPMD